VLFNSLRGNGLAVVVVCDVVAVVSDVAVVGNNDVDIVVVVVIDVDAMVVVSVLSTVKIANLNTRESETKIIVRTMKQMKMILIRR
jgi:hypothetical protein